MSASARRSSARGRRSAAALPIRRSPRPADMSRQQRGRNRDKAKSEAGAARPARGDALFAEAQRLHQAGALDEAEALYRRIVAADPAHAKALHYLGALAAQRGALNDAATLIERA